ncbi:MAG: hypothetical protein RL519_1959, partial [Pseudomonadota bacterium]
MDAEGRVFGDTIDDPLPEWKQPPLPPVPSSYSAPPLDQRAMQRSAWEE